MSCKCGARSREGHIKKFETGYPGHTYQPYQKAALKK